MGFWEGDCTTIPIAGIQRIRLGKQLISGFDEIISKYGTYPANRCPCYQFIPKESSSSSIPAIILRILVLITIGLRYTCQCVGVFLQPGEWHTIGIVKGRLGLRSARIVRATVLKPIAAFAFLLLAAPSFQALAFGIISPQATRSNPPCS